jgi:hypothetical protein
MTGDDWRPAGDPLLSASGAQLVANWVREELTEFSVARHCQDAAGMVDADLDLLGIVLMRLGMYTKTELEAGLREYEASQVHRGRPCLAHRQAVADAVRALISQGAGTRAVLSQNIAAFNAKGRVKGYGLFPDPEGEPRPV